MSENSVLFKKGDFVRLKAGLRGTVGVIWQIQSKPTASIVVYWNANDGDRFQQDSEPKDLELVPFHQVPEYAVDLKKSLGF